MSTVPTLDERLGAASARYSGPDGVEALAEAVQRRLAYRLARSAKACDRCKIERPLASFSRDSREPDGIRRYCRECDASRYRERARVNADSA